jgi:DNA-binding response OmpR family regulator
MNTPANQQEKTMRILVAEDDTTTRMILVSLLQKWGYEVEAVHDGAAAWARLQQPDAPLLVILDWLMPGLDGTDVCRRVRTLSQPIPPHLIMLTSQDDKKSVVEGLQAGANDYLGKPFDKEELRARLAVGQRVIELQQALATRIEELQNSLAHIKTLQGILPICMHCHKIRNDQQSWERIEAYISNHTEARFSHGICAECVRKRYPEFADEINGTTGNKPAAPPT